MASVTLSSVGTATLILDYLGAKTTTARVTLGSTSMTVNATLQMTLDSSWATNQAANWFSASSVSISSAIADAGLTVNFLTPIAGLRLNSSAISASNVTLTALQNAGG